MESVASILRISNLSKSFGITSRRFTCCSSRTAWHRRRIDRSDLELPTSARVSTACADDSLVEVLHRWRSTLSWLMKIVPNTRIRITGNANVKNIVGRLAIEAHEPHEEICDDDARVHSDPLPA